MNRSLTAVLASVVVFTLILIVWNMDLVEYTNSDRIGGHWLRNLVTKKDVDLGSILRRKVKILCWILTNPKTIRTKAKAINQTWAQHCDIAIFISSQKNENPPATVVNVKEGRQHLTYKTRAAFQLVYDKYYEQADWFIKTDDDTFLILDNLRYLLAHYDPRLPIHFGHQFNSVADRSKFKMKESWHSGGAGYVLSREALRRLVTVGMKDWTLCPFEVAEDFYVGQCLERLGVVQGISADRERKPTFLALSVKALINEDRSEAWIPNWYNKYSLHPGDGTPFGCCSDYTISFHYVNPDEIRLLYFLVYRIRLYGLPDSDPSLVNTTFSDPDILPPARSVQQLPEFEKRRSKGRG